MTDFLGAGPGERTESRSGYRAGYYGRVSNGYKLTHPDD